MVWGLGFVVDWVEAEVLAWISLLMGGSVQDFCG